MSSFSLLKACSCVSIPIHSVYSTSSYNKVLGSEARPSRNRCKKFTSPRNPHMYFLAVGVGNSSLVFRFLGWTCQPSEVIKCPRISTFLVKKRHLLAFK